MLLDDEKLEEEKEEKKEEKKGSGKRKLILLSVPFAVLILGGTVFLALSLGEKEARVGVRTPLVQEKKLVPKKKVERRVQVRVEKRKEARKERVEFRALRDVFKDFYTKKFVAKIEKKLREELEKEYRTKLARIEMEKKSSLPDLREVLLREIRVFAILCTDRCYAYTDKGVLRDGEVFRGVKVKVTESGVRFEL